MNELNIKLLFNLNIFFCYRKLNELLTDKVIKFLHNKSIKDFNEYMKFYQNFSVFIKEGIMSSKSIMEQVCTLFD